MKDTLKSPVLWNVKHPKISSNLQFLWSGPMQSGRSEERSVLLHSFSLLPPLPSTALIWGPTVVNERDREREKKGQERSPSNGVGIIQLGVLGI